MRESILRDYFVGFVDESDLSKELFASAVKTAHNVITHSITDDLPGDFEIQASHLIRVCDAFLSKKLKAEHLEILAFTLLASDCFVWDDENAAGEDSAIAETVHSWASPEINYPLTSENVIKFKHLLSTGESLFI